MAGGSQFLRFMIPLVATLKELDGSASPTEAKDLLIEKENISEVELAETITSGESRIRNQIGWARFYLVKAGYMNASQRGIWSLTEKGLNTPLDDINPQNIFKEVSGRDAKKTIRNADVEQEEHDLESKQSNILAILRTISPFGFERLCQRLLRESGFKQVNVLGKTNDGGIDGEGLLEINPFVSFKVLFQCKRYQGSVGSPVIRDLRGAMQGRADKGILITTGNFTMEAKKEALRDGAPPIELVDGEKLVEMFEKLELGVKPRIIYEVDHEFFKEFI
jgi:restriction system protein